MTQDTERWTIYVCPECGSLSGVEQPCPDVAHAYADEDPPIVERYVPASTLQALERERDEARVLLARLQAAVEQDKLVPYNAGLTARAEAAEEKLERVRENLNGLVQWDFVIEGPRPERIWLDDHASPAEIALAIFDSLALLSDEEKG